MSTGKIYKITNLINGKIYIGKTVKALNIRFREHICTAKRWAREELENRKHPYNSRLYPSMNKYGYDSFKIEQVEEVPVDMLKVREKYWIEFLSSTDDSIGYNISPGGLGGPLFKGHKQSEYCKQVSSALFKGVKQNKAFVKKRSRARARQMQSLVTGEIVSILDLKKGYFFRQTLTNYRIYKSDGQFYACLESPHNKKEPLTEIARSALLQDLESLVFSRSSDAKQSMIGTLKASWIIKRAESVNAFLLEHNINKEEYIQNYNKYKDSCPNRHLELIYKIPYEKVRYLNKYFNLSGGRSGHKNGKVVIEENN